MTWKIELGGDAPLLSEVLQAQAIWRKLTAKQRVAMLDGYKHGLVDAHIHTMASLEGHGLMHTDCRLTDAGRIIVRWNLED